MKKLIYETIGKFGNTLFGIFNLLSQCDKIILRSFYPISEDDKKLFSLVFKDKIVYDNKELRPKNLHGNPHIILNSIYNDNDIVEGFFQYMPDVNIIQKYRDILSEIISTNDYIVIHVRRGDFMFPQNNTKHATMCKDYYKKAMSYFPKDSKFMVVSDDIEWCKENIKAENITYSNGDMYTDFCLLLGAKGIIYGNSTFGYWGALLNPVKDKLVVANKFWYKNSHKEWNQSYDKLYPENYPDKIKLLNFLYM